MKCPKCNDNRVTLVPHENIRVLVCGEGHVIAIDTTSALNGISQAIGALAETVKAQEGDNRKKFKESLDALTDAIKPPA